MLIEDFDLKVYKFIVTQIGTTGNGVWPTSGTFLTKISFWFNEKLSHHPLTK